MTFSPSSTSPASHQRTVSLTSFQRQSSSRSLQLQLAIDAAQCDDDVLILYSAALGEFASGQFASSADLLRCVTAQAPHDAAPYFWLAKSLEAAGHSSAGFEAATMCVELLAVASQLVDGQLSSIDSGTFTRREASELYEHLRKIARRRVKPTESSSPMTSPTKSDAMSSIAAVPANLHPRSLAERSLAVYMFFWLSATDILHAVEKARRVWNLDLVRRARHALCRPVAIPLWIILCCVPILLLSWMASSCNAANPADSLELQTPRPGAADHHSAVQWVFVPYLFF